MNQCIADLFAEAAAAGDHRPRVYVYLQPNLAHLEWSIVCALVGVFEEAVGTGERSGVVSLSSTCGCDDIAFSLGTGAGAGRIYIQIGEDA